MTTENVIKVYNTYAIVKIYETDSGIVRVISEGPQGPKGDSGSGGGGTWGSITGTLSAQTDLQAALNGKAASSHTHVLADVTNFPAGSGPGDLLAWDGISAWGSSSTSTLGIATFTSVNTWTFAQTFRDTKFLLRNAANTFSTTINASNATAARSITFPDAGGTVTVLGNASTGSGAVVLAASPVLTTPALGVATATSINGVSITGSGAIATGTFTLTVAGNASISGTNTGDQTITFVGMSDGPGAFSGNALKGVRVNATATALEYFTLTGGGDAFVANPLSQFAPTTSLQLAGVISDETGSGSLVFATSPTLVTPLLGTPTSGTLTNCNGLPISTGVSGLAAGIATFLATPSSANLLAALTDETGTGANVFASTPTLVTPIVGSAHTFTPTGYMIQSTAAVNGVAQFSIQNSTGGTAASAGYVVNNDASTDTTGFAEFGVNSTFYSGTGSYNTLNYAYLNTNGMELAIGTSTANGIHFYVNNGSTDAGGISSAGAWTFSTPVRASGVVPYITVTPPADTGRTAATESVGIQLSGRTATWADGTVAAQREIAIKAPTYNKTTTSATFTKAATVAISAAPAAGTGVTITSPYALWVESGTAQFDGGVSTTTVTTTGAINKVTITAPATSATLTLITGSSLITAGAFALTLTSTATTNATFPAGTITLQDLSTAQTISGAKTFGNNLLKVNNAGATFATTIGSNVTAARSVTLPDVAGSLVIASENSPASISTDQLAFALGQGSFVRVTATANCGIGGFAAADIIAGRMVQVCNIGSFPIRIKHQDSGATATNRIMCPYGLDFPMRPLDVFTFIYDNTTQRWRLVSGWERILVDPKYGGEYFDDLNGAISNYLYVNSAGGGAMQGNNSVNATQWGASRINVAAVNSWCAVQGNTYSALKQGGLFEATVALEVLSNATEEFKVMVGFFTLASGVITPTNGCFLLYDRTASTFWQAVTRTAGAQTAVVLGTAPAGGANSFQMLRVVMNSAHTGVDFYVNDMVTPAVAGQSTNVPANTVGMGFGVQVIKTASATSVVNGVFIDTMHAIRLDYIPRF